MAKGGGGVRSPQESQTFEVRDSEGNLIPVNVPDARQLAALKIALEKLGQPLPPSVKAIRVIPTSELGIMTDPSEPRSVWDGVYGGVWMENEGVLGIQPPNTSKLRERFGADYNLTASYVHTWLHEMGHAYFTQLSRDASEGIPTLVHLRKMVELSLAPRLNTFFDNWQKTHGGSVLGWAGKVPHRLDNPTEWFAENFATFLDARDPAKKHGLEYYRPTSDMVSIFERMEFKGTSAPATKVGPWEVEFP